MEEKTKKKKNIESFNKKKIFKDIINSGLSMGIYILATHVLFMPFMAKHLSVDMNAELVFFVMVYTILATAFGGTLGTLFQINKKAPMENKNHISSYIRWLQIINIIVAVVVAIILKIYGASIVNCIILALITILINTRYYNEACFRDERKFDKLAIYNGIYLISILIGIVVVKKFIPEIYYFPLMLAETVVVLLQSIDLNIFKNLKLENKKEVKDLAKKHSHLTTAELLSTSVSYADKLMILPLLGKEIMNIYYSGTVLSKMIFLVIKPINSVMLAWLTNSKINEPKKLLKKYLNINVLMVLFTFVLSIPMIYATTWILYKQNLEVIKTLLVPLSLVSAFSVGSTLLYTMYLKFSDVKNIKYINIATLIIFIIFAVPGAKIYGVIGFAYGNAISKFIRWMIYYQLLKETNLKNKDRIYNKYIKRLLDIIIAIIGLVLGAIPFGIFALWVKLDSKGKVIFTQERIGKDLKVFKVYKLRTMITKTNDEDGNRLSDPERLTKPGKIARAISIDEIPQFFNILKGDMSLIGPRPMPVRFCPYFTEKELRRHDVRPGLTGLAQVKGRAFLQWNERFAYDVEYVDNISFGNDVKIFFHTIKTVLKKEGTSSHKGDLMRFDDYREYPRNDKKVIRDE